MGFFDFFKGNKSELRHTEAVNASEPENEDLKQDVIDLIRQEVLFGFADEAEILEATWDLEADYGETLNEEWLKQTIADYYTAYQEESRRWKQPTDFDRLARAFDMLNREKIIALHKAGYTKQDGYSDVSEVISMLSSSIKPAGYCFYHTQDLERAIDPTIRNLFLAFDSIPQNDEQAVLIGNKIVATLHENGLKTAWDGTVDQRIEIKDICWQKVPDGEDWSMERAVELLKQGK